MAATLFPPALESVAEEAFPDDNGNGIGGGGVDNPWDEPHDGSEPAPERRATPLSVYRAAMVVGIVWILTLFATLTIVLEFLRIHSKHWTAIPIPHVLYLNAVILTVSSLTIEIARFFLRSNSTERCVRWLLISLLFGVAFVGGQILGWQELILRGHHLTSNAASFCFFLITAAHAVHLLGGIAALSLTIFALRYVENRRQKPTGIIFLYWHFINGLWLYVLAILVSNTRA